MIVMQFFDIIFADVHHQPIYTPGLHMFALYPIFFLLVSFESYVQYNGWPRRNNKKKEYFSLVVCSKQQKEKKLR